jgi:hypothetical protein
MVAFAPKVTIACLRQVVAFAPKVIKCAAYGVAIMNGRRDGYIDVKDLYNDDVGKGGVRVYEAYEVNIGWPRLVRVPLYFINLLPTSLLYISILLQ